MTLRSRRRPLTLALVVLPVAVAIIAVWATSRDAAPDPVDVTSSAPVFDSLDELVAASDLVVVATFGPAGEGRAIGDPADPRAGVLTTLSRIDVEEVLAGQASGPVVVETPTRLLDGTPVTVDGVAPPSTGERAVLFLVSGRDDTFPYTAVVGPQGRLVLSGGAVTVLASDPLSRRLGELDLVALRQAVRATAG